MLQTLKDDMKKARLSKDTEKVKALSFIISEIEYKVKNGTVLTDDFIKGEIKKQILANDEILKIPGVKEETLFELKTQNEIYQSYLGKNLTNEELEEKIKQIMASFQGGLAFSFFTTEQKADKKIIGIVMAMLNKDYKGLFNGSEVPKIITKLKGE